MKIRRAAAMSFGCVLLGTVYCEPSKGGVHAEKEFTESQGDPDVIARPEYKNSAKVLGRNLASVRGMLVLQLENGQEQGKTNMVIATSTPIMERNGQGIIKYGFAMTVGREMQISFDEAVRAVRVRYPFWESSEIQVSFQDKYSPKDGGSAGMAYALLLLSLLENIDLDPDFAVTGDITVDWRIQPVGGIGAKVRGAMLDGCKYAAIPSANRAEFSDLILTHPRETICKIQVFSVETLQEATKLIPKSRKESYSKAMKAFSEAVDGLNLSLPKTVIGPDRMAKLEEVLALAPNHLSAETLLQIAKGKTPKRLSAKGSIQEILSASHILNALVREPRTCMEVSRRIFSKEEEKRARERFYDLEKIVDEGTQSLLKKYQKFLSACGDVATRTEKFEKAQPGDKADTMQSLTKARERVSVAREDLLQALQAIESDRGLMEKMLR